LGGVRQQHRLGAEQARIAVNIRGRDLSEGIARRKIAGVGKDANSRIRRHECRSTTQCLGPRVGRTGLQTPRRRLLSANGRRSLAVTVRGCIL
jgi:hypothetical protein